MSRRRLIKLLGGGATTGYLLWRSSSLVSPEKIDFSTDIASISPMDRSVVTTDAYSGDIPHQAHNVLWSRAPGAKASLRRPASGRFERTRVAIVGGGMAGLVSAWQLRKYKPVVLEQADRFGGNARGESWHGIDYSVGAAYFSKPEPERDRALYRLYDELGVDRICRIRNKVDPVRVGGRVVRDFWSGESAPEAAAQFRALARHFTDVGEERNGRVFPRIPSLSQSDAMNIDTLDRTSFQKYVEEVAGGRLHPHLETAIQHYCWSAFALPWNELGAAAGLNFYASEFGPVYVAPGGNGAIAELVLQRLTDSIPMKNLRTRSLVCDVSVQPDGVDVIYVDRAGQEKQITADVVVMACPKFVVSRLIGDLEPERAKAIKRLRYHSYLVANVLLTSEPTEKFYDLYLLGQGQVERGVSSEEASGRQGATDAVLANYGSSAGRGKGVVTLYRGFPYDGARSVLYGEDSFQRFKGEFLRQIRDEVLTSVGLPWEAVNSVRICRWGHPLPAADRGLISDGIVNTIRKPFRDRVFFAEQDNWMLPSMESSVSEALTWSEVICKQLGSSPV